MNHSQQKIFTVSRLNREVKYLLEGELGVVWIMGEISNLVVPASGHWYFTLKDEQAQLRCAMFRGNNNSVRFRPKNGDQVLVRGRLSLYEARGDYQLIAETMEPAGDGLLKQQFEKLKQNLAAEGLFASHFKQPLPEKIQKVGVITSHTGAALKDIIAVAQRRQPWLEIIIYPSLVQGEEAAANLVHQLQIANLRNEVDVLILGRGGGSLEDLWCFNDEQLARAIFASALPVISAVGHEIDFTIADFVADHRAPTPSAAAEMVTQDSSHFSKQIAQLIERARRALMRKETLLVHQYKLAAQKLQSLHPERQLQQQQQSLDELSLRLHHGLKQKLSLQQMQLQQLDGRLQQHQPQHLVTPLKMKQQQLTEKLLQAMQLKVQQKQQQLANLAGQLDIVSPLATLSRGYSISFTEDGEIIRDVKQVKTGDKMKTQIGQQAIHSQVL